VCWHASVGVVYYRKVTECWQLTAGRWKLERCAMWVKWYRCHVVIWRFELNSMLLVRIIHCFWLLWSMLLLVIHCASKKILLMSMLNLCDFWNISVSQGSATTSVSYSGTCNDDFVVNLVLNLSVKECWKSINISRSYGCEFGVCFFLTGSVVILIHSVCICTMPRARHGRGCLTV